MHTSLATKPTIAIQQCIVVSFLQSSPDPSYPCCPLPEHFISWYNAPNKLSPALSPPTELTAHQQFIAMK